MNVANRDRRVQPASARWRYVVAALALLGAASGWLAMALPVYLDARAARAAVAAGDLERADVLLRRWLRARPQSAEAWFLRAVVALNRHQPHEVLDAVSRARALGAPEGPVERLRCIVLARSLKYDEAEPGLRRALDASPRPDPEVTRELARIYLETYRLADAAAVLRRWTRDAPRDATPYLWHTEIDRRSGAEPDVLIGHYRAALERDPDLARARLGLAEALRSVHRNAEASAEYERHLVCHPDDAGALLGAGMNASESGDDPTAIAFLEKAIVLAPADHRAMAELASIALRRGKLNEALDWLDQAVRIGPQDRELHYRRSVVLARLGRPADAEAEMVLSERLRAEQDRIRELHDRLTRAPDDVELQHEVAVWLMRNGHDEEAFRWAERIVRKRPGYAPTNRLLADYYDRRGEAGLANYYRIQVPTESLPVSGPP